MSVKVKICGVTRLQDALFAAECGAEFIGLNFYNRSPRSISPMNARPVADAVRGQVRIVGVFVNAGRDFVTRTLDDVGLDLLQFHGDEDGSMLRGWPVPVIRALRIESAPVAIEFGSAGFVLVDRFDPALFGGTGRRVDLGPLAKLDLSRVFLAGGLNPDNVGSAAALNPYAVDAASGVESAPGIKDHLKLRSFIANAKSSGSPR